ncbi:MAG TPA: SPFH domain-containing protein, partial [Rhodopila sp.]|nr:SPFH domain-containing protein [Rhodopila sp.]
MHVPVAIQYRVLSEQAQLPYYQLGDETKQITSYVLDMVRAAIPNFEVNEVFVRKDHIAQEIATHLTETMALFGLVIDNVLVTDMAPAPEVKAAMNESPTQQRLRLAATTNGDADKTLFVKRAEAEAEAKRLQG